MLLLWLVLIFSLPKRASTSPGHSRGACLWARASADHVWQAGCTRRTIMSCVNSAISVTHGNVTGFRRNDQSTLCALPSPKIVVITSCCTTPLSASMPQSSTDSCATTARLKFGRSRIPTPAFSARPNAMSFCTWNGGQEPATGHRPQATGKAAYRFSCERVVRCYNPHKHWGKRGHRP